MEALLQQFYDKKPVLVTGGAGFIGSHVVDRLVALGARVTVLDNFSTGNLGNLKNVAGRINLLYADIRSPYSCLKATAGQEVLFHLAAFVSVPDSVTHPELCMDVNAQGTRNLLQAAEKNEVRKFVFSSSSAVYGQTAAICDEEDQPAPSSPYAESKLAGEAACQAAAMPTGCLRYFNVYGDRQNPHGSYAAVVAKFTHCLRTGQPVTIFGDGQQTRDFVPVAKVVEANLLVGLGITQGNSIFNIGSGQSVTLLALLKQLETDLAVPPAHITFLPARQGDIKYSQARCGKFDTFVQNLIGQDSKTC